MEYPLKTRGRRPSSGWQSGVAVLLLGGESHGALPVHPTGDSCGPLDKCFIKLILMDKSPDLNLDKKLAQ